MRSAFHSSRKDIRFKLAMGQMYVEGSNVVRNLNKAVRMIEDASRMGCKMIVLPECLDIGWANPAAKRLAQKIPGKYSKRLCHSAKKSKIYVAVGLNEKFRDAIYNSAILISPEGKILLKHRKINELKIALDLYATGDSLSVVRTPLGTIGMDICADNSTDSLFLGHSLAKMGAKILVSPCAWAVKANHDNKKEPYYKISCWKKTYKKLSRVYNMAVVGVSNVGWINTGVWKGRKCIGCSLAVGPGGKILAEGPYGESAESLMVIPIKINTSKHI